jgi:hypothetical protein
MGLSRRAWFVAGGVAAAMLLLVVGVLLVRAWWEPWHQTRSVVSADDRQVCVGAEDLESGYRSASNRCFDAQFLPGGRAVSAGDCVRLELADESARIIAVAIVDCPRTDRP